MQRIQQSFLWRPASIGITAGLWLLMSGLLGGCAVDKIADLPSRDQVIDPIRDADLRARWPSPVGGHPVGGGADRTPAPMVFPGSDQDPGAPSATPLRDATGVAAPTQVASAAAGDDAAMTGGGIEINFDNTDIQTVAKSLLGDSLSLNYVIDSRVQGNITLASARPVPRKDVLPIFESVLRMWNASLLHEGNLIRIVPLPEAAGVGAATRGAGEPGFGVSIVPLRYASAAAIAKTAEGFLARPGAVRVDQPRNILLIQGTASERRAALDVIATFDVEWLRNQSVGLYPLKSTAPETIIRELERVFDTAEGGQGQGMIKFQPMSRMNAVLAVSRNQKTLDRATQWIQRLDRSNPTGTTVRIYGLRFGNARTLARILNEMFVGRSQAGSGSDTSTSPTAPGQSSTVSRLDSLGSGSLGATNQGGTSQSSGADNSSSGTANRAGGTQTGFESFSDRKDVDQDPSTGSGATGSNPLPRGVFQNVRITADTSTNSIIIYSNQEDYLVIERALETIDRPPLQVAVDAMVAEVTLTDQLQYGVQSYLASTSNSLGSVGLFNAAQSAAQSALLERVLPGFNLLLGSESNPKFILSALSTLTTVKVLSSPSLVVADNQPAVLEVGDQVPISTGSATVLSAQNTVVNTITLHNTGIILKVLPHVHPNGSIELEIEQEISNVVTAGGSASSTLTPTIAQRRIHSTISTTSGQTVLLGGLIKEDDEKTVSGVPGIAQIKYLGDLLSQKSDSKIRSEIIVFVSTKLVRNSRDAQVVAEEFKERLDTMRRSPSVVNAPIVPPAAAPGNPRRE